MPHNLYNYPLSATHFHLLQILFCTSLYLCTTMLLPNSCFSIHICYFFKWHWQALQHIMHILCLIMNVDMCGFFSLYCVLVMNFISSEYFTLENEHFYYFYVPCGNLESDWVGQHCILKAAATIRTCSNEDRHENGVIQFKHVLET